MRNFLGYIPLIAAVSFFVSQAQGAESSCLVCQFSLTPESQRPGQEDVCEDLFGAACVSADGSSKYEKASKTVVAEQSKFIREAQSKTAREMGYKDIDDAVKSRLKDAGLTLKDPVNDEAWKNLMSEDGGGWMSNRGQKLYSQVEQCEKEKKALEDAPYYSTDDIRALQSILDEQIRFNEKYRQMNIKFYAQDLVNFVSSNIGQKCTSLTQTPESYTKEENPEAAKACKNLAAIRREAVELFRSEGSEDYQKKAEAFVSKNLVPELTYHSSYSSPTPTTTPSPRDVPESQLLRQRISKVRSGFYSTCTTLASNLDNAGKKVVENLLKDVNRSKATVESVIDSSYGSNREKLANEIFGKVRGDLQDLVSGIVKDPKKRSDILNGYDGMKLSWMKKPEASAYSIGADGRPFLDEAKTSENPMNEMSRAFFDPQLSFFKTVNAFYLPDITFGKMKSDKSVTLMPVFNASLEKNPFSYLSVLAHEEGHNIGLKVSQVNGYDLSKEYKDILACYKDPHSIRLQENQADETLADYFSSEILAREIGKLPEEKRKAALMSAMEPFCLFADGSDQNGSMNCREAHPESSIRVGGIYGANPSIRKMLGCQADSSKYKTCGLDTSILDVGEKGSPGSKGKKAKDLKKEGDR